MRVSNVGAYTIWIYKRVSAFMLFLPWKHKRIFMYFLVSPRNTYAFLSHSFSQTSNSLKQLEPFGFLTSRGVFQCCSVHFQALPWSKEKKAAFELGKPCRPIKTMFPSPRTAIFPNFFLSFFNIYVISCYISLSDVIN